jgi:hypothetical protein
VKQNQSANQSLLPDLPSNELVQQPPEIDRFLVRLWPDGRLYFKGPRERIDEFLVLCKQAGLHVQVDHISLCG